MQTMKNKDFLGNSIEVGDEVVFLNPGYRDFKVGMILNLTPRMAEVWFVQGEANVFIKVNVSKTIKKVLDV